MKTIEEKAKAYDEAIKVAENIHRFSSDLAEIKRIEQIFPELKESENIRIIKAIKYGLDHVFTNNTTVFEVTKEQCLAWLEKQGQKETDPRYENLEELLAADDIYQMAMNDDMVQEAKTKAINALSELEIGKLLGIEKQGEKEEPQVYETGDGEAITYSESEGYKVFEPKFKVGDWIVDKSGLAQQVLDFRGGIYTCTYNSFTTDCESNYHLWTIQDAKDGDVLADGNLPFIFKKIDTNKYSYAYCGISVDSGFKIESDGESGKWTWMQDIKPATKEQRDLLFQKIKEAGYEWDAGKKELRNVEQKPTWSEEDEKQARQIERIVHDDGCTQKLQKQIADWLKSLKDRCTLKPSKEQIKALEHFVRSVGESGYASPYDNNTKLLYSLLEQLKKLKG